MLKSNVTAYPRLNVFNEVRRELIYTRLVLK